jgi:4-aminobutyrate aminotransferase-like enzyme
MSTTASLLARRQAAMPRGIAHATSLFTARVERDKDLTLQAANEGLILHSCGDYANVIRIHVPLTASDAIVDEGLDKLENGLRLVA